MRRTWLRGIAIRIQATIGEQRYFYLTMGERGQSGIVIEYDESDDAPPSELALALVVLWSNVRTDAAAVGDQHSVQITTIGVTCADGAREIKLADYGATCCRYHVRNPEPPTLVRDALVHLWNVVRSAPPPVPASRCQAQPQGKR